MIFENIVYKNIYFHKCNSSSKLIIFFSGTDKDNGLFDFWNTASKTQHSYLLVNNGKNEWYQRGIPDLGHDLMTCINELNKFINENGFTDIYCIGMSMGGYGACLFGSLLNAKVLAFGFDSKIKIPGSRSLKRMKGRCIDDYSDLIHLIESCGTDITQIAGECDAVDLYSCSRISHLKTVSSSSISGVGHGVPPFIKKNYDLNVFINNWIEGGTQLDIMEETNVFRNIEFVESMYSLHLHFTDRNWDEVIKNKDSLINLNEYHEYSNYMIGVSFLEQNKVEDALSYLLKSVAIAPHFSGARYRLARAMMKKGLHQHAKIHLRKHTELSDKPEYSYMFLSDIYMMEGQTHLALYHLELAEKFGVVQSKLKLRKQKIKALLEY